MSVRKGLKKIIWMLAIVVILLAFFVRKGENIPPIKTEKRGPAIEIANPVISAFKGGEEIKLRIKYLSFIPAGVITIKVDEINYLGREVYHLSAEVKSSRLFSFLHKFQSLFESYMDARNLYSLRFEEHTRSGGDVDERLTIYDQEKGIAETSEEGKPGSEKVKLGESSQDFLSLLYFLRTRELKAGEDFTVNLNDRKKNYEVEAKILRREEIKVSSAKFAAWVAEVKAKRVGKKSPETTLTVWLSDDTQKLPLLIKAKTTIGPMEAVMEENKN